jgi:capsular polysaccharide export protein
MGTAGILKLRGDPHPSGILEGARAVYTVGSHLGFEALLWGVPVRTFGAPFYAGWGLTSDQLSGIKHRSPAVLEDLVHAALIECSRYRHPETGEQCDVENIIEWLALQRRMRERFPRTLYAAGFSPRKSRFVRDFLQGSTVHFVPHESKAPPDGTLVRWGPQDAWHGSAHRDIVCCEDGFLRSVGLGAGLAQPLSWALDRTGIYYDSGAPSDIELSLANAQFDSRLLDRAVRLRQAIVQGGVTKYNVGVQAWVRPPGRRNVILVPGQVERDAAIRLGCPGIRTNLELLQSVRAANPEAYIVYKPHPDIVAGLRAAGRGEDQAAEWCDEQLMDASLAQLFPEVDEVHVLTSLAGFEALLREKKVVCHGQPFYSGWGLTTDMVPVARRARVLSLDVLVAAALILYPTYISRVTGTFTTPERVIEELRQWREERARRRPGSVENLARRGLYAFLRWKE